MNKSMRLVLLLLIIVIFSSINIQAAEMRTVAIIEFENTLAGYLYRTRGLEQTIQDRLNALLTNSDGFRVVEKAKIKAIIEEQKFSLSGLVDESETAIELGKLVGADHIITGTLNNLTLTEFSFSGYGTNLTNVDAGMESSIRLINVTTGIIEMANSYNVEEQFQGEKINTVDIRAVSSSLLNQIIREFERDINNFEFVDRENEGKIQVSFSSIPSGANVEIDGLYMGSTPLEVETNAGVHQVRITLGGYEPWEMSVRISREMNQIEANLGTGEN